MPDVRWAAVLSAAVVSIVTMPLTAMWFLLLGGLLVIGALMRCLVRDHANLGAVGSTGLGLLAGPAIYIGLALVA